MSTSYIPLALRRLVAARANQLCEYCLMHEDDTYFGCQVDHVISEKHGGPTNPENTAYAVFLSPPTSGTKPTVCNETPVPSRPTIASPDKNRMARV